MWAEPFIEAEKANVLASAAKSFLCYLEANGAGAMWMPA
jgi:hypothetical protein|tara:strand:+ start:487 stop:603 length:117 start_codon:yes stop_codon:yes gene_type:complete